MQELHRITVYRWTVTTIAGSRTLFQGETDNYRGSVWSYPMAAVQDVQQHLDGRGESYYCAPILADGEPPKRHHMDICMDVAQEQAEYDLAWPRHCTTCNGSGTTGSGRIDYDTGAPDIDPCEDCCDRGICPRCGVTVQAWLDGIEVGVSSEGACPGCGWTGQNKGNAGPQYTCECWDHELTEIL